MLDLDNLKEEPPLDKPQHDAMVDRLYQKKWPPNGEIQFNNVYLKY